MLVHTITTRRYAMKVLKVQIDTLTAGDYFKYCGRTHQIISITHTPDNHWDVVTDRHPLFTFPADQKVTAP